MARFWTLLAAAGLALAQVGTAAARDRSGVDYGQNDNRHYGHGGRSHHRSGAWIGNDHGHGGPHHGGHFGAGHGHFSPRGQGGYHWGW